MAETATPSAPPGASPSATPSATGVKAEAARTPVPRSRDYKGPAVLAQGFRPFFLLAGVWAVAALALSLAGILGALELPSAFDALRWHIHEMLFGYVAAAMAGFLLTAIPNWTGRMPLQGLPLLGLVLLWLAGRAANLVSLPIGPLAAALIDVSFLVVLAAAVAREILASRQWRNLGLVAGVTAFALCNALSHAGAAGALETEGWELRLGVAVPVALITLIGGRIVPSFTRNWLAKRGATRFPAAFGSFDRAAMALTLPALLAWALAPGSLVTGGLAALAAAANLLRLLRWRGFATRSEPLLWVLHLAYLWVPLGLALIAAGALWPGLAPLGAAHALTAGAIGGMTLAVMSRATLGHSGRALSAGAGLTTAYVLVTLAAAVRVAAPLAGDLETMALGAAGLAWVSGFLAYLRVCAPILLSPRPDKTPG